MRSALGFFGGYVLVAVIVALAGKAGLLWWTSALHWLCANYRVDEPFVMDGVAVASLAAAFLVNFGIFTLRRRSPKFVVELSGPTQAPLAFRRFILAIIILFLMLGEIVSSLRNYFDLDCAVRETYVIQRGNIGYLLVVSLYYHALFYLIGFVARHRFREPS